MQRRLECGVRTASRLLEAPDGLSALLSRFAPPAAAQVGARGGEG